MRVCMCAIWPYTIFWDLLFDFFPLNLANYIIIIIIVENSVSVLATSVVIVQLKQTKKKETLDNMTIWSNMCVRVCLCLGPFQCTTICIVLCRLKSLDYYSYYYYYYIYS